MRVVTNPPNPFLSEHRELLDSAPCVTTEIYEERARTILSRNESPDLPFRWSVNPYQGCFHACAYCYARPSHEYWGFGAGTDFESKLMVKSNAAECLQQAFEKPSWKGELVVFSGNTDCYQPLEASYRLTNTCLAVCRVFQNPTGIITKSCLILRDIDLLQDLTKQAWLRIYMSIPFASDDIARKVEPQAPSITRRFDTLNKLSQAGISTAVSIAPIIPGLNEHDIPAILQRARDAGATDATYALLRLNGSVEPVFLERMAQAFPDRVKKMTNHLRAMRGGKVGEQTFFQRHAGQGPTWETIKQLFDLHYRKAGFHVIPDEPIRQTFRRPHPIQTHLFETR